MVVKANPRFCHTVYNYDCLKLLKIKIKKRKRCLIVNMQSFLRQRSLKSCVYFVKHSADGLSFTKKSASYSSFSNAFVKYKRFRNCLGVQRTVQKIHTPSELLANEYYKSFGITSNATVKDIKKANYEKRSNLEKLTALAQANNFLAVNLHKILAEEKGNVFFSPFSISTAMAMLLCAAESTTEAELMAALGYNHAELGKDELALVFQKQMSTLSKSQDFYTLACANCMLSQKDFEVKEKYKSILNKCFKALLLEVDFPKDTENVVSQINNWVKEKTRNMIPKLLETLGPATGIVLINAVYFKGNWLNQFNKNNTYIQNFYNKGTEDNAKLVDMMHMKGPFLYFENESYRALQLPYAGKKVAMLLLLPRERNGLDSLESSLTPSFIQELKNKMIKKDVEVTLPRFRLEYSKSLVPCFKRLGVDKVFHRGAELGIASDSKELAVSEIIHKAVLKVNEEGSEAAAATKIRVLLCSPVYPRFVADHPFAFVIYDTKNDLILFMGRVEEL